MLHDLRVLVVEDSPSEIRLIRESLKGRSIAVEISVARDGVEAMDYLARSESGLVDRPDIILLDLNLPRKNGLEVLEEIKSSPNLKRIPVLVMTSSVAEDDVMRAYASCANCYIKKPRDLDEYEQVARAIEDFWFMTVTLPDGFRDVPAGRPPQLGG